jgi:hypothetical protein
MRKLDVNDVQIPPGFHVEIFAQGLNSPVDVLFSEDHELYLADAGVVDGNGKVLRKTTIGFEVVADGFHAPLTGIAEFQGQLYVSHRGKITRVDKAGKKHDVLSGLPSQGDHTNHQVVFGPDGKMYFGQGTATNSGVAVARWPTALMKSTKFTKASGMVGRTTRQAIPFIYLIIFLRVKVRLHSYSRTTL